MKRFLLPILSAVAIVAMFSISSCKKCEDSTNPDCPNYEEPDTTTPVDTTPKQVYGNLLVISQGGAKPTNNNKVLAVLGQNEESMYWNEYIYNDKDQRPVLKDAKLVMEERKLDTFYSRKGSAVYDGNDIGAVRIEKVPVGTYYLHVLDAGMKKYTQIVAVTADSLDDTVFAKTSPVGHLEIQTGQSSIIGSEIDSVEWRLYGTNNDTFLRVAKAKMSEIDIEPYFRGKTGTTINERGQTKKGVFYLTNIPAGREYMLIAYNSVFANDDGAQPNKVVRINANKWVKVRLSFTD